jgi:hypothetical protein
MTQKFAKKFALAGMSAKVVDIQKSLKFLDFGSG